jgi:predicted dehydrogenase
MSKELRIGMVGAGMISAFHLQAWSRVPDLRVVAIADPDPDRAAARAAAFAIPAAYADLSSLLAHERVDALDVASPRETHADLVREAARHGLPVLCQKPLAPTLEEAERLLADLGGRIRLMVHENWRWRPYYRQIAAWAAEGRLGAVTSASVSVRSSGLLPDPDGILPALARQPFFAGETRLLVAESLIHQIDVVRWLFGPLRHVASRMSRTSDAVVGETVATILMERVEGGAPIVVDGNLTCPFYPAQGRDLVEIIGTRASITMAADRLRLHGEGGEEIAYEHPAAYQASFDGAVAHFVSCLRSGAPFETDGVENLETLRLVEAAYDSAGWPKPA